MKITVSPPGEKAKEIQTVVHKVTQRLEEKPTAESAQKKK